MLAVFLLGLNLTFLLLKYSSGMKLLIQRFSWNYRNWCRWQVIYLHYIKVWMNPVGFSLCSSKYHWRMRSGAGSAHLQRLLRDLRVARTCGRMAARTALVCLCAFFALFPSPRGSPTTGSRRTNQDRCAVKVRAADFLLFTTSLRFPPNNFLRVIFCL